MEQNNSTNEINIIVNLFRSHNYDMAIAKGKRFIKKFPEVLTVYNVIGLSFSNKGDQKNAVDYFKKALQINPYFLSSINNLGNSYKVQGYFDRAKIEFEKALQINPNYLTTIINLANYNRDLNRVDDAIKYYFKALEIKKDEAIYFNLGILFSSIGEKQNAKINFEETIKLSPFFIAAHAYLVDYTNLEEMKNYIEKMKNFLNKDNLNISDKIHIYFALGKAYEISKDYKNASLNFKEGNIIKNNNLNISINRDIKQFNLIKKKFLDVDFSSLNKKTESKKKAIFIIGLPRSGTTLVEQIISSHSNVYGAGELMDLSKIIFDNVFDVSKDDINLKNQNEIDYESLGNTYLSNLKRFKLGNKIITDKAPLNFRWVGFLKLMLPDSKIIHCNRNKNDNFLSIYINAFESDMSWVYSEDNINHYYSCYKDLMNFWHKKMPNFIYDCNYENLIENTETTVREILKFCDLQWEEDCLDFKKNKKPIYTASVNQVRKGIYKTSQNKWKKYEEFFPNLFNYSKN